MAAAQTIAGYTTPELASEWLDNYSRYLTETLEFHADDEEFREDCAGGVPAEILNTSEQEAWNILRAEFSAFGLDAEAEEAISEIITTWREDGTLTNAMHAQLSRV
jgi:hypothetical protein